jgi:hypothetical protein
MTGCQFAKLIVQNRDHILAAAFHEFASEEDVSRLFETGTQTRVPVFALFTSIKTEAALIEQLSILARGSRWRITRELPAGLVTDDVMIGVEWQIGNGCASSVMGLAPFATMPVTRRAPYVCLAAWPGGHDNPHWTRYDQDIVHFLDTDLTALQLTAPKYRSLTKASKAASELLLAELGDDARHYRRVAFRLQSSTAEALRAVLGTRPPLTAT